MSFRLKGDSHMPTLFKSALIFIFMVFLLMPVFVSASGSANVHVSLHGIALAESGSAEAMVADVVIARPVGLLATIMGSAVYVVALPFSLLGGNEEQAREKLIKEPGNFTFKRPLGEFESLK